MVLVRGILHAVAVASLAALGACAPFSPTDFEPGAVRVSSSRMAPLVHSETAPIEHNYMIVMKPGVSAGSFLVHRDRIGEAQVMTNAIRTREYNTADFSGIKHVFDDAVIQGYAGTFSADVLAYIRDQPEVAYVEQDSQVQITMVPQSDKHVRDQPVSAQRFPWENPFEHVTENGAPWGLARLSHRQPLGLGTFNKYVYESLGGEGVTAYVIDTGINVRHSQFGGRARWGKTIPAGDTDTDEHGHGTHCAGTIGAEKYGVAKKAELVAVKVLRSDGSGAMSDVVAGVLWAVADAQNLTRVMLASPHSQAAKKHRGFVANMSLGGMKSPTLDMAVNGAVEAGMHFGVAAGNENQDACNVSPAGAKRPITVGASTIADKRAYFSNVGPCVDVFAPGLNILSTWNAGPNSINTISGTSMASPHIVGLMAYLLSIYGSDDFGVIKDAPPTPLAQVQQRAWTQTVLGAVQLFVPSLLQPFLRRLGAGRDEDSA
ncbi:Sub8p [Malassezia vespertilionis]|uniref:Sub8p n=1 Tax=Malassezia vespertilionis TaxID=2020962 RepID=A0A2N1JH40_9BASI|nr:Sub8p [Malassezia vespertilionis]